LIPLRCQVKVCRRGETRCKDFFRILLGWQLSDAQKMRFELDTVLIEESCRASALATRIVSGIPSSVQVGYVADGRLAARPLNEMSDPFGAGKRRMVVMTRRGPFLMGCPASSTEFACCGYLVLILASNCPMDCSYCFLQEHLANNPGFQVYANHHDALDELDRLARAGSGRSFRIGTGELADSLAFDSLTGISRDLVSYFSQHPTLMLELKTKTDEIDNLLALDPRGRTMVSWSLSPMRVFAASEHRTAPPPVRIDAARRVLDAGYTVGFHLDPLIAYPDAERDYLELLENVFDTMPPKAIAFFSIGGLRMTPGLRTTARRRFPADPMLLGEDVLGKDGRYRTFTPLRLRLFSKLRERIAKACADLPVYLCMETASMHHRVFGAAPPTPTALGSRLAGG
jgi:spore photoproduct lyase